jgi:DNA-binding CsgD family transcriptional regulator
MARAYAIDDRSIEAFRDACARAATMTALQEVFLSNVAALGFRYAALCNRTHLERPRPGVVIMSNLPRGWIEHHVANGFHHISPTFAAAERGAAPFFWSDPAFCASLSPAQTRVMNEARDFGLKCGFSVPLSTPGGRVAVCSLSAETFMGVDSAACALGGMMGMFAYERARELVWESSPTHLSRRERECLTLAATGKSDWAIGQILHLSHTTVHNTLERAKARLGVSTRIQGVIRAIQLGEIVLAPPHLAGDRDAGEGPLAVS